MTERKLEAIALSVLLVLSAVAIAGFGTAAEVRRGGDEPTFDPGVGGDNDVVVTRDKPTVFRGEDNIEFVDANGSSIDPANLIGVSGDAEGIPLEIPVPRDQALGQYAFDGDRTEAGVTVQQPRVTDLELLNEEGADVADSSIPEDEIILVRAEWNFATAEDLDLNIFDDRGNEITGDVLADTDALSEQQIQELTGPFADNPEVVGTVGQRGTGTDQVFLQGIGQFNETALENRTLGEVYWAIDLSDQPAGQYVVTVEGWDDLDFGAASRTATVDLTTETDVSIDVADDEATRGQFVPFTLRGSSAGLSHIVAIEDDDFRNNQVDERVFRDVEDIVARGTFDEDGDGTADFAWAEVLVDEDTGLGEGQLDTVYLDDTNVDVNVFEAGLSLESVADAFGDPEDDDELRVLEGELTIQEPFGTYIAGAEVDVRGTAEPGIEDVVVYARDQGDWELLDIDEDGQIDEEDVIPVDANGEWEERDVVLSEASDILAIPGRYRFGVIEVEDARDDEGNLRETLTTSEFSAGASEQTSILVTEPGLGPAENQTSVGGVGASVGSGVTFQFGEDGAEDQRPQVFQSYNGQVATEDGVVDVVGVAPGQDDVLVILVDSRGRVATEQVTVDDDDVFEEDDIPLVTADGRELNEGPISAAVYALGRDNVGGDGIIPGEDDADLAAVENYIQGLSGQGLTRDQVTARIADETIDEAGSDDLFISDQFRYTDGATTIETIKTQGTNVTGINPVSPGDTMVVRGVTNRKPDDNTVAIDVTEGPSVAEFPAESTDEWNFTGVWSVTMQVPEDAEPGTYTIEADDGDNTDIVDFEVVAAEEPTENVTETPTENVTETPTENVTETPTENVTETPAENVTETPAENVTETPAENVTETPEEEETPTPEMEPPAGEPDEPATIEIRAAGSPSDYQFSVTGNITPVVVNAPQDSVEGDTAMGRVGASPDRWEFTGEITDFSSEEVVTVLINGEEVDPETLGEDDNETSVGRSLAPP